MDKGCKAGSTVLFVSLQPTGKVRGAASLVLEDRRQNFSPILKTAKRFWNVEKLFDEEREIFRKHKWPCKTKLVELWLDGRDYVAKKFFSMDGTYENGWTLSVCKYIFPLDRILLYPCSLQFTAYPLSSAISQSFFHLHPSKTII